MWFIEAFTALSTERPAGFELQQIPWSRVVFYVGYHEFDKEFADLLWVLVLKMDNAFIQWHQDNKPKDGGGDKGGKGGKSNDKGYQR